MPGAFYCRVCRAKCSVDMTVEDLSWVRLECVIGRGLRENTLEQVGLISCEGNLLGVNCLLHSFDSRRDVSA